MTLLERVPTSPEYAHDTAAQAVWRALHETMPDIDGVGYYRHPIVSDLGSKSSFVVITPTHQPIVIRVVSWAAAEITSVVADGWKIGGQLTDSPVMEAEDYAFAIQSKIDEQRLLRRRTDTVGGVVGPNLDRTTLARLGLIERPDRARTVLGGEDPSTLFVQLDEPLNEDEWKLLRAVIQGAIPLSPERPGTEEASRSMGQALRILDRQISALDTEQEKVALQVPPGPQRIRGLAGTGKTVLLAMRAANIHQRQPQRRILFTFHTQSLYNQIRRLIARFYRYYGKSDPNWDFIHVRHAWGGRRKPGVYSELADEQGRRPLDLRRARAVNAQQPFAACCAHALQESIAEAYDYVFVDEAQDFPPEFFQLLYRRTRRPKAIYWAYDELQSLSAIDLPSVDGLFGSDDAGQPLVSLDGLYPGEIEKDLVLQRSYRCPREVLMLAHAIGLGLKAPGGCVQILRTEGSWNSVGYQVVSGALRTDSVVTIERSMENSPNRIGSIYTGNTPIIDVHSFENEESELVSVADAIAHCVLKEDVDPERIVLVCLGNRYAKETLTTVQQRLWQSGVNTTIPGYVDDVSDFAEKGRVTLTTVFRAKGNEAGIVFVMNAEQIASFTNEIDARNRAFTAISRSKGWVQIFGSGRRMPAVEAELRSIMADLPRLTFTFPNPENVRNLDAEETTRRRQMVKTTRRGARDLLSVDPRALSELSEEERVELIRRFQESLGE